MIRWLLPLLLFLIQLAAAQTGATLDVTVHGTTSAELTLWPIAQTRELDPQGRAVFEELSADHYRLEVRAAGCAVLDTSLSLNPGECRTLSLRVQKLAATLSEVVVQGIADPTSDRVFSRSEIAASAARDLPTFLGSAAGIDIRSDGSVGSVQTARIGGSTAGQVMVLVDGRRLKDTGSGEADLNSIPLEWIESIEVERGGRSDAGGEAIGGILKIITRGPGEHVESSGGVELHPTYRRLNYLQSARSGPVSGLFSFQRTQGAGDFSYRITEDDGTGEFTPNLGKEFRRQNADILRDQLMLKLSAKLRQRTSLELSGTLDRASRGMPGYIAPMLTPLARQNAQQEAINLRIVEPGERLNLVGRLSYQHDWKRFTDPDLASFVNRSEESSHEWEAEVRSDLWISRTTLSSGLIGAQERLFSSQIAGGQANRLRSAVWSKWHVPILENPHANYSMNADPGLRWEEYGSGNSVLPYAALSFEHTPSFQYGITLSAGRSYQAPTFYSLFWLEDQATRGNPDLKAEKSVEYTGRMFVETQMSFRTRVDLSASIQNVNDLIVWKRTFDSRWAPVNLQKARIRTLDISADQTLIRDVFRINAGINWTEARDGTSDRNTGGKYLTFRAPRSLRAGLTFASHGFNLTATGRWVSARPILETNSKWLREYSIADLHASYRINLRRVQIEPAIGVNNMFNEDYRIVRYAPMPEREIYAAIRISQL